MMSDMIPQFTSQYFHNYITTTRQKPANLTYILQHLYYTNHVAK